MASRRDDDATLVEAAKAGDQQAFTLLFERWFDRSYDVAWRIVRNRDTAAEVAQDAMLASWQGLDTLRDPSAFGGWVLRTARNKALNRLKKDGRSPLLDAEDAIDVRGAEAPTPDVGIGVADAERDDLVWAAAAALGERDASLLDLHLRHGLDAAELGEALGVTTNNAHQLLFRLKKKLATGIRAWVLWHGGRPRCEELAGVLAAAGATSFDAATAKLVERHADGCPVCEERRAAVLAPEAMFAAVPLLPAPLLVKQQAASALAGLGVPVDPGLVGTLGSAAGDAAGSSLASGSGTGADLGAATGSATGPSVDGPVADAVGDVGADLGAGAGTDPTTVLEVVQGSGADAAPGAATGAAAMAPPPDDGTATRSAGRRRVLAGAGAAAVVLVVLLVILLSGGEDEAALDTAAAGGADRSSTTVEQEEREQRPTTSTVGPASTAVQVAPPPSVPDAPPSTTGPTVVPPPTTATTAPTTTSTTEPTTTTTAAPPEVEQFTSTELWPAPPGRCPSTLYSLVTLVWDTTGADAASIAGPGASPGSLPADGTSEVCVATSQTPKPWRWTLTATGPGGTATATTEILAPIL